MMADNQFNQLFCNQQNQFTPDVLMGYGKSQAIKKINNKRVRCLVPDTGSVSKNHIITYLLERNNVIVVFQFAGVSPITCLFLPKT